MKQKIYEILTSPKKQTNGVILNNCIDYSADSIKRTVHLAFHGLFSLLKILFNNSKQYF